MKRTMTLILGAVLMFMLAACSQKAEPAEKEAETDKKGTEETMKEKELTLEEVFKKTEEANKDIKSFESEMTLKQKVESGGESQDIDSDISLKYIADPMALHQKMTMASNGQKQELDAYLTKDGFYMYEPTEKVWLKLPEEFSNQILQLSNEQTNPSGQLDQLKEFVDEFDFKQDPDHYILTLKASGDKFDQFLKDQVKKTLPGDLEEGEDILKDMKFKKVEYELLIDKKTFYLNALNMVTQTETNAGGETINMDLDMKSTYSNYNKVESIEIPKEALENAQEITTEDLGG